MLLKALIFCMIYVKYLKNIIVLLIIVFCLVSLKKNHSEMESLKQQIENLKNNLYQTNEVVEHMQIQLAETK